MKARFLTGLIAAALLSGCAVQPGVGIGVGAGTGAGLGIGLGAGISLSSANKEETKPEKTPTQREAKSRDLLGAKPLSFISKEEKAEYQELAIMAIAEEMPDASEFTGKSCELRLGLSASARLEMVNAEGGDPALCSAAIAAARQATFPHFVSDAEARALHRMNLSVSL